MHKVYEDSHLTQTRSYVRLLISLLYITTGLAYLSWRLTVFNNEAMLFSVVFYMAELYGFIMSFLVIFISWKTKIRIPKRPDDGLSVDVFVTTYNEPLRVIRRTALAAMRIKYPHETWLLDDGNREEILLLANELGCHYLTREKNIGAKAGNLNNALKYAKGDYLALFDADHVADPDFLHKTLGYFKEPKLGFVQTPQDYYNIDSFQHGRAKDRLLIWHEQSYFHYVGQPGRDYWNATTLCGCSAVISRHALDQIGGFPEETVTEDMHCAVRLQKAGYKTAYHAEPLAFGIAPNDLRGFLRQRLRWGEGNMQVCREERLPFTRKVTFHQRLCYFALTSTYLDGWQKLIYYIAPIFVLFTQIPPIWTNLYEFSLYFIPYFILSMIYYEETGRGYGRIMATEKYAMARFAIAIVATLGVFRKHIVFRVSSKELPGEFPFFLTLPHIMIFILGISAILFTLFRPALGIDLHMPASIGAILVLWTLINTVLAGFVIHDSIRSSRMKDEEYRFKIPLPIRFKGRDIMNGLGIVKEISSQEILFTTKNPILLDGDNKFAGEIFLPELIIKFKGKIRILNEELSPTHGKTYYNVHCFLEWDNVLDRDELELSLISCKWHRKILNQHENCSTPIDNITKIFSYKNYMNDNNSEKQIVLYFNSLLPESNYKLGYLTLISATEQLGKICVFEDLEIGNQYSGFLCTSDDTKRIEFQVVGYDVNSEEISSELDYIQMNEYYVVDVSNSSELLAKKSARNNLSSH